MIDHELIGVTVEKIWLSIAMLLIGLGMIAMAFLVPMEDISTLFKAGLMAMLVFFGLIPIIFCPRYYFSFRESGIVITIGYLNLIKIKLDRNKITHVGMIEWSPLKHFGGSGIKGGMGEFAGYLCFNVLSGEGLEIKTTEKNYVIEMHDPDRQRVLAVIGDYPRATKGK